MTMNISWAFAGNAAYAGCQWLVFVLLVRSLPLADVGRFAYWIAVTGPVFVLANVRLRSLLATGVSSPGDFSDYLTTRLLTTTAAVGIVLLIASMVSPGVDSLVIVALIACARACDSVSEICHGLFQRELDMRSAAMGLMTNGLLSVVLVGLSLAISPSLVAATGAYAAGSLLTLAAWDLPRMRRLPGTGGPSRHAGSRFGAALRLMARAMPLGLSSAVGSLQINLPRYVVAASLGPAPLAIFTALAYVPTAGNLVANAVAQAALPVLARDLRTSRAAYAARLRTLVQCGLALGAGCVLAAGVAGRAVVAAIYGAEVAREIDVLLWLMAAAAVSYGFLFLGTGATARMRFGSQLLISSAGLLTVACCAAPLVNRFGLVGAAYALCAGALVEAAGYAALTVRDFRVHAQLRVKLPGLIAEACGR